MRPRRAVERLPLNVGTELQPAWADGVFEFNTALRQGAALGVVASF
ncbi:MAG: hypothetical protein Q8S33_02100 [Myxococcales bacterium]|nr:hypothetical protein [Myxococcales bacterium]MDP3499089.1 hypothetical protein [Myxococcales bacterium]